MEARLAYVGKTIPNKYLDDSGICGTTCDQFDNSKLINKYDFRKLGMQEWILY